eukprot:1297424-Karenia_brevis.AAC.1
MALGQGSQFSPQTAEPGTSLRQGSHFLRKTAEPGVTLASLEPGFVFFVANCGPWRLPAPGLDFFCANLWSLASPW